MHPPGCIAVSTKSVTEPHYLKIADQLGEKGKEEAKDGVLDFSPNNARPRGHSARKSQKSVREAFKVRIELTPSSLASLQGFET